MSRERLLILYALLAGSVGWLWLLVTPQHATPLAALALFATLTLAVDTFSFRVPPADTHSLSGIVLLSAALALGPAAGALIGAGAGALAGVLLTFIHHRPRSFYLLVARPFLRGGSRATAILAGAALATIASGQPQYDPQRLDPLALILWSAPCYLLSLQLGRIGREYLQGGRSGVSTWWRSSWRLALGAEFAPLPLALLGAAIYTRLGSAYFLLAGLGLVAAAAAVRRATLNLASQRRSVRELALLNEVSRAIIRSELDVATLCELIYREASKIVDTASFHLGLFEDGLYTLMVRVQDRVRLPPLTVDLSAGDGLIGWMRQTGKALLVEDFASEMERLPARPRYQSERPPRSGIYVPLIAGDAVIGSISVQSYRPHAFGANDLRLLSLIADQAAVAIARARAFAQARQRAVQLLAIQQVSEQISAILDLDVLLPAVVQRIREHFGYHPVHIFTISAGDERIHFRASTASGTPLDEVRAAPLQIGQGLVGHAAATGTPILVGDVDADPRYIRDSRGTRSELAVPLRIGEQVVGVLDVQSDNPDDFDADDLFVMRTLADQIAVAIESANAYRAQQEEAWTLNALLQVAENISGCSSIDALLATAVRLPPLLMGASRCYVLLWERAARRFSVGASYGLGAARAAFAAGQPITPAQAPILAALGEAPCLISLVDAATRALAWPQLSEVAGSGSLVLLALLARAGLLGVLVLDYDRPELQLDERQHNLCVGAARQVAAALESLLLAREAEQAAHLEQELLVAREIQHALLPARTPDLPGWQIDATYRSARLVGGDFYDFWPLTRGVGSADGQPAAVARRSASDDPPRGDTAGLASGVAPAATPLLVAHPAPAELGFVIADVSDKGVPAALFMGMSRSLVRAAALDGSPPALALERANRWISRDSESGMFVTLFYGVLEPASGRLRYSSAGHNPPLHYRVADGSIAELRVPGIALGVLEAITLNEAETWLAPGDVLVCYTDGVTEAIDDGLVQFGLEQLRALIVAHHDQSAAAIGRAISAAVDRHGQGQPPFDDVTLVVIKREPN
ncbi:MAG: SpoIIE family protein phosphatase [Chloroflexi bacterium]|nr:SpoIIE family protein phosphatase [Chloroflexota bacterium]